MGMIGSPGGDPDLLSLASHTPEGLLTCLVSSRPPRMERRIIGHRRTGAYQEIGLSGKSSPCTHSHFQSVPNIGEKGFGPLPAAGELVVIVTEPIRDEGCQPLFVTQPAQSPQCARWSNMFKLNRLFKDILLPRATAVLLNRCTQNSRPVGD